MDALMNISESKIYRRQLDILAGELPITSGVFLVTGATGLIGSCIVDVLCHANETLGTDFQVFTLSRSVGKLSARFPHQAKYLHFVEQDITEPLSTEVRYDYIIHAASNADPRAYAVHPYETILTNILGARNVLEYCKQNPCTRVLLTSTFEVYGRHEADGYAEDDFGVLNQNAVRSGYPESKRTAELMFRSASVEYGIDCVIARLSSVYGPTMLKNDSKAHAQFLRNGLNGKPIILKSEGLQKRTYCYVMDSISGIFTVLFRGKRAEAYNVANKNSVATIAEVARTVAELCAVEVVFNLPDSVEKRGYSAPQNCVLQTDKIEQLNWCGRYSLRDGLSSTLEILKEMKE